MINCTTSINIVNNIPRITKWQVSDAHDHATQTPPYMILNVELFGPGAVTFEVYNCIIYDAVASTVLTINPAPQQISDQFLYTAAILANQYTVLSGIWNANVSGSGTRTKRLAALELALVSSGVLPSAFVGS